MRPNESMVTLADGRQVSNYSEDWRHECECRWLLANKPTRSTKHLHLYGVEDRATLFSFNTKTGQHELRGQQELRALWGDRKPLMNWRGLAEADRILADARKLYELAQAKT